MYLEIHIQLLFFIFTLLLSFAFCYYKIKLPARIFLGSFVVSILSILLFFLIVVFFPSLFIDMAKTSSGAMNIEAPIFNSLVILSSCASIFLYLKYKKNYTLRTFIALALPYILFGKVCFSLAWIILGLLLITIHTSLNPLVNF